MRTLEKIDPRKMKREEQLAFWINIHNALVMHVGAEHINIFVRQIGLTCDLKSDCCLCAGILGIWNWQSS